MNIELKNLTKEQREDLKKQIEKMERKELEYRKLSNHERHFFIGAYLEIKPAAFSFTPEAEAENECGNYFFTKEDAEKHTKVIRAFLLLSKIIAHVNDGWVPDWNKLSRKCFIYFNTCYKEFEIDKICQTMSIPNELYIKDKETALKLLESKEFCDLYKDFLGVEL